MGVFLDLFTNLVGLLSLFTIAFIIVMGFYLVRYFSNRMSDDERNAAKRQQRERDAKA